MRHCVPVVAGHSRSIGVVIAMCVSILAGESFAISRYDTGNKSCIELRAIVRRDGAAILRWRSQRFVRNMRYCPAGQITDASSVPAADGSCSLPKCVELEDFYTFW
jgi:hypothetical protein